MIIEFIVGLNEGGGGRLSSEFVRIAKHAALEHAGKKFGGCTVTQGEGSWLNGGELVVEECLNIRIIMPDPNDDRIHGFAHALRRLFAQDAIAVNAFDTIESFMATAENEFATA